MKDSRISKVLKEALSSQAYTDYNMEELQNRFYEVDGLYNSITDSMSKHLKNAGKTLESIKYYYKEREKVINALPDVSNINDLSDDDFDTFDEADSNLSSLINDFDEDLYAIEKLHAITLE